MQGVYDEAKGAYCSILKPNHENNAAVYILFRYFYVFKILRIPFRIVKRIRTSIILGRWCCFCIRSIPS